MKLTNKALAFLLIFSLPSMVLGKKFTDCGGDFGTFLTKAEGYATQLGVSLGKLNYCLKALKEKGLIKIKNFKKSPKKINYIYVLTPLGITTKTRLTVVFMKKKLAEYDELNKEFKLQKKSRFAKR